MKKIFSIGETAKLNGISIKTLRYYDKIGLLKPRYIDETSGYRYYTYDQFSYIDKIKRFKSIGVPLQEVKQLFFEKKLSLIDKFLSQKLNDVEIEITQLREKEKTIRDLLDFYNYSKLLMHMDSIYFQFKPTRYIIYQQCKDECEIYQMDLELRKIIGLDEFQSLQTVNPYGYILDGTSLLENQFIPNGSFVSVQGNYTGKSTYYRVIPSGNYLCFQAPILSGKFNVEPLKEYIIEHNIGFEKIIASEYLTSLYNPKESPYELQIRVEE